ncbi:hypothetical protein QBC39DRAFT_351303 [Podospora conica]|nr:hypothetical protein QBC39DRAFT_351303 [Schizothecium conicum]
MSQFNWQTNAGRGAGRGNNTRLNAGTRGGWQGQGQGTGRPPLLSNNGNPLVGAPIPGPPVTPMTRWVEGMEIIAPVTNGKQAWDHAAGKPAQSTYQVGSRTKEDPLVIWICQFGKEQRRTPGILDQITKVAKEEAIAMGFPCVIIRKEPHKRQFERTLSGRGTTRINQATGQPMKTLINSDLHLTVYMGNGLQKTHIQGHIFLDKDPSDHGRIPTKVTKMADPSNRKYVPPGEEPVTSEYWLCGGVEAYSVDKKTILTAHASSNAYPHPQGGITARTGQRTNGYPASRDTNRNQQSRNWKNYGAISESPIHPFLLNNSRNWNSSHQTGTLGHPSVPAFVPQASRGWNCGAESHHGSMGGYQLTQPRC